MMMMIMANSGHPSFYKLIPTYLFNKRNERLLQGPVMYYLNGHIIPQFIIKAYGYHSHNHDIGIVIPERSRET